MGALLLMIGILFTCKNSDPKGSFYKLPDLSLLDWDGNEVSLLDFEGKVLVLDVWATWCEPCSKSVPVIEELKKRAGDEFVFIGVNTDQNKSPEEIYAHAQGLGMSYLSLLDTHNVFVDFFQIQGLPGLFVYSKKGNLLYHQYGLKSSDLDGLTARISAWKKVE
jgi:thiol-disulfide isomerase/thioredoxin